MNLFRKPKPNTFTECTAQAQRPIFYLAPDCTAFEKGLYEQLRASVPVVDACIAKIVRLTGDFKAVCQNKTSQQALDSFVKEVPVGISGLSLNTFADMYLDSLLTYGKSLGEYMIDNKTAQISGLYIADSSLFQVRQGKGCLDKKYYCFDGSEELKITHPERILYTALNPTPKNPQGVSILRGIPALADILMTVYSCIGNNFDRVGNVRYAVTYKPNGETDKSFAKERAMEIAREWSDGMQAARSGVVKDFVAVGDVEIKVIGAENQIIDTQIPVRQLLEQIISKLSIPPFLLGLSWSSTERMASQQADILTSELEYYRRLLTPSLKKICKTYLALGGYDTDVTIEWANINLQDEEALARARLYNAQAQQIENSMQERNDNN